MPPQEFFLILTVFGAGAWLFRPVVLAIAERLLAQNRAAQGLPPGERPQGRS